VHDTDGSRRRAVGRPLTRSPSAANGWSDEPSDHPFAALGARIAALGEDDPVSHDLAVYVGPQPEDAAAALAALDRLRSTGDEPAPPAPAVRAFLDELAAVLPDDHEAWSSAPMADGADGATLDLQLTYGDGLTLAMVTLVDLAHRHGLVCVDLSAEDVYLPMDDGSAYVDHLDALEPPEDPATAVYARFVRDVVSPALRALGFQGSGGRYRLRGTEDHVLVGLQGGTDNDAWQVSFTVNLACITAEAWASARAEHPWLKGVAPTATTAGPERGWRGRLGMLADPPGDRWWTLRTQDDIAAVAAEVLGLLRDEGVPELRRQLARAPRERPAGP